jgi:hypothetical protein
MVKTRKQKDEEARQKEFDKTKAKEKRLEKAKAPRPLETKKVVGGKEVSKEEFKKAKGPEFDTERSEELKAAKSEKGFITPEDVQEDVQRRAERSAVTQQATAERTSVEDVQGSFEIAPIGEEGAGTEINKALRKKAGIKHSEALSGAERQAVFKAQQDALLDNLKSVSAIIPLGIGEGLSDLLGSESSKFQKTLGSLDKRKEIANLEGLVKAGAVTSEGALVELNKLKTNLDKDISEMKTQAILSAQLRGNTDFIEVETTYLQQLNAVEDSIAKITLLGI